MKITWQYLMVFATTITLVGVTNAQTNWNQPSQIGSYETILKKAGYRNGSDNSPRYGASAYQTQSAPPAQNVGNPLSENQFFQDDLGPNSVAPGPRDAQPMENNVVASDNNVPCDSGCGVGTSGCGVKRNGCAPNRGCAPCIGSTGRGKNFFSNLGSNRNYVIGITGLVFERDYEDDVFLSYNPSGAQLLSTDADLGEMTGYQVSFASRGCDGRGWEARYWSLNPGSATAWVNGTYATTRLAGLVNVNDPYSGQTAYATFNAGESHTLTRTNDINNLELNFMRNGGTFKTRRCKSAFYELMGGFRWFQFDEDLYYSSTTSVAPYSSRLDYNLCVENTLLGFQLGGRTEICLTNKLRFSGGTRLGIYNNRVNSCQNIVNNSGSYATIGSGAWAGQDYNFQSQKDDISFLGEVEFGIIYQLGCKSRFNLGYRAMGISGIALAANQIPNDYTYLPEIGNIKSNGDLMMHGAYFGIERCF